jgi:putative transposase
MTTAADDRGGRTVPTAPPGSPAPETGLRVYRFALDPTPAQVEELQRHAGAARWAFNHALAAKVDAHRQWRTLVDELVTAGVDEAAARRQVKVPVPSKPAIQRDWNRLKGDTTTMTPGYSPWWREVSTYAFQSAFADADRAWSNWLDSLAGRRAGRRVGYPRFKKKGRARESFRIHHDVKRPTIRLEGYRRLRLPRLGSIRVHDTTKRLARRIARGEARITSAADAPLHRARLRPRVEPPPAPPPVSPLGIRWGSGPRRGWAGGQVEPAQQLGIERDDHSRGRHENGSH